LIGNGERSVYFTEQLMCVALYQLLSGQMFDTPVTSSNLTPEFRVPPPTFV